MSSVKKGGRVDPLGNAQREAQLCGLILRRTDNGLALEGDGMTLLPDFRDAAPRIARGRLQQELLVRAAKIKRPQNDPPLALDATAGLGEDSLLLAAAGFHVRLFERNPVVAALLQDSLARAATDPQLAPIVARMEFIASDSIDALAGSKAAPDIVYLDPMFPARQKSAAVKKKFQLLHHLEAPCEDAEELLHAAFIARPRKIVIKRPPKGPYLAGIKPSYSLEGKAVRYDVIAL